VRKQIFATIVLQDEAKTLGIVEKLHDARLGHSWNKCDWCLLVGAAYADKRH